MEATAVSRYILISSKKARLVADLVRGKTVQDALGILALTPKKASPLLRKAILSAKANVQVKSGTGAVLADDQLVIKEVRIDEGPTMKRIQPRSQGRAFGILKRMSHIKVVVETLD